MIIVQMDFDNTISAGNISIEVRNQFAPQTWVEMEKEYNSGKYSVEESNVRQYALISSSQKQIETFVLQNCNLKEGFAQFIEICIGIGVYPVVVSSGLDFYINPLIQREGLKTLEVISASGSFGNSGIEVNYSGPNGENILRGFKETYLRHFKNAGNTVIYFGDNESDFVSASEADFVFACDSLVDFCKSNHIPHKEFGDFSESGQLLIEQIKSC